jgi:ABC-type multidrug transport system fused ATPase/permease subunit
VLAEVNSTVQESITGIGVAKNFRQEQRIYDEFKPVNAQTYRLSLRQGLTFSSIFPILGAIAGIGTALVVYFGGMSVIDGVVSAGDLYLFVEGISLFWFPLISIASFWSQFQLGLAASERVFALIDAEPRVVQVDNRPAPRLQGRIEFRNLDFRYTVNEQVLRDFNLTIPAGETLALVGHTGAGKSSLGKLVARFYEFQGGQLLVDGQDLRTFDLHSYRRQLGIVPQTPFLFAGTVADNIRYGKPDAAEGLDVVLQDRTAIVIAHRLSTIKAADRIIVLREGQIIEEGNHAALMQRGGHYAELYDTYYRHQSADYRIEEELPAQVLTVKTND